MLESIQPFAIALLIGLCAGIERERIQDASDNVMGVRTFVLIAMLGSSAAFIDEAAVTAGILFFLTILMGLGYWRSTQESNIPRSTGLTTEFAGGVVFILAYFAKDEPLLAASLGAISIAVLYFRKRLHSFAREVLRPQEIVTTILLSVFAFVVIPFLPNQPIDPWGLVNPRQLAQVVVLIAVLEFCGYIAERVAGPKVGLLATGFLGGLASSTATFLNLSRTVKKHPEKMQIIIGASLLAVVSPLLLFLIIISASSPALMSFVALPTFAIGATSGVLGILIGRQGQLPPESLGETRNPLDLPGVVKLAALLSGLLIIATVAQRHFGSIGVEVVSFIGGLFDLHGVTLANATLHATGTLDSTSATLALVMAVVASFISKIAICWVLAPWRFALTTTALLLIVVAAGGLAMVVQ